MHRFAIACLICLIAAQPVLAGAWLREKGDGFVAFSSTIRKMPPPEGYESKLYTDYEFSLYADYGLTSWVTAGIDAHETMGNGGHALLFLRLPVLASKTRTKLAIELGAGGYHRHQRNIWQPMYRLALSVGYGFTSPVGPGWMAADTTVEYRQGQAALLYKFDATIGLSSPDHIRPMLQLETAIAENLPFQWKVTPSLLIPGKGKSTWVIGIEQRSYGVARTGLKLALWRRF
ncbi:MAG: hypothetical protein ACI92Z_001595 [Paracoccaceae bacterium]|jgi:hypothetical protein